MTSVQWLGIIVLLIPAVALLGGTVAGWILRRLQRRRQIVVPPDLVPMNKQLNWIRRDVRASQPTASGAQAIPTSPPPVGSSGFGEFGQFGGVCPDCGGKDWFEGPSGGMNVNIKCSGCGLWLNYSPRLGLAQRIGRRD